MVKNGNSNLVFYIYRDSVLLIINISLKIKSDQYYKNLLKFAEKERKKSFTILGFLSNPVNNIIL